MTYIPHRIEVPMESPEEYDGSQSFQKYIDLIKCEDCGAANMTIYMTGVDRKRRCRKCHAEYIRPNPPARLKGKKK